jgi:methyltransferase-like protein 6
MGQRAKKGGIIRFVFYNTVINCERNRILLLVGLMNKMISSEFSTAVALYQLLIKEELTLQTREISSTNIQTPESCQTGENDQEEVNDFVIDSKGSVFSANGPAPYQGDILENPELLWTDDVWTKEKEENAKEVLQKQGGAMTDYWKNHYIAKAGNYWNDFYKRNQDHFYKDRHYIHVVFPELQPSPDSKDPRVLLEVGCGVGNAALPLLDINPCLHIIGIDFAKSAIQIFQNHIDNQLKGEKQQRIEVYHHDITNTDYPFLESSRLLSHVGRNASSSGYFDYIMCMFVLSAVPVTNHLRVLQSFHSMMKEGGKLFLRDYGRYDEAQLRFKKGSKVEENFYVRQDGTCSYFFTIEELTELAQRIGFEVEEMYYIHRQYANRQQKKARYRVWIHAKLVKVKKES